MSLKGIWIVTQHWDKARPYKFPAKFGADGTIEVEGAYFGTWTVLGSSNQLALALANFKGQTITSYSGNVAGFAMGGQMTGGSPGRKIHKGVWSAQRRAHAKASKRPLDSPGKG